MPQKVIVLDIGNVLIEWQPERFYDQAIGIDQRKKLFSQVDLHAMNDKIDSGQDFKQTVYKTARDYPKWQSEIQMWHDCWLDIAGPAIEHSVRLMKALQAKQIPIFSLTNFGIQPYQLAVQRYSFLQDFNQNYISGYLRITKPNAHIYQILEKDSGTQPNSLLYTDDRQENVDMANSRGWLTHLFDGPQGWGDRLVKERLLTPEEAK
ncbi:MAG: HAD family phosphatase [Aestuariivita sp.]|nr:HAD family phosphatase [Aestuariivita sp.]